MKEIYKNLSKTQTVTLQASEYEKITSILSSILKRDENAFVNHQPTILSVKDRLFIINFLKEQNINNS